MTEQPGSQPTPREPMDLCPLCNRVREEDGICLPCELEDSARVRDRMAELLTGVANALKGDPGPLKGHDWSDLPKLAARLRTVSAAERAELLEVLEDVVNQACLVDDGTLDSMALSANADALLLLARLGRVETISVGGRRVIARWADTAEASPEPTP